MPRWRLVSRPVRVPGRSERCSSALGADPWLRRARSVATRSTSACRRVERRRCAPGPRAEQAPCRCSCLRHGRPSPWRTSQAAWAAPLVGDPGAGRARAPPGAAPDGTGGSAAAGTGSNSVRRLASDRRIVPEAGSAVAAQDDRLPPGRADDLKPTRSTTRVADTAPPPGGFCLDQVFGRQRHCPLTIERRSRRRGRGWILRRSQPPGGHFSSDDAAIEASRHATAAVRARARPSVSLRGTKLGGAARPNRASCATIAFPDRLRPNCGRSCMMRRE